MQGIMKELNFNSNEKQNSIEIVLQVRDKNGKPTGKTKNFASESHSELSGWYEKQKNGRKKRKKNKRKK